MKQLTCEMCGSTDLIKQDGVFVCQSCGCKYSVDEAKKMMVDGTVDVTGSTIKVDISDELANLYLIARRAKDDNNAENAAKYYDMILVKDPTSWEAAFYVVYFKAMECRIAEIESAAISVGNCLNTVLRLIKDNVKDKDEQIKAVQEVTLRCNLISTMLYDCAQTFYQGIDTQIRTKYKQEMLNNCCAARDIMYVLGDNIDLIFGDYSELHTCAVEAWKDGISKHGKLMPNFKNTEVNKEIWQSYAKKVSKYDETFYCPPEKTGNGCYIATAVYGSYDCPQVWTLRRYRDNILATTWYGRAFIRFYYAISPTLVKWFGNTEWFRKIWRGNLDRIVTNLKADGVEDTPYEDKTW